MCNFECLVTYIFSFLFLLLSFFPLILSWCDSKFASLVLPSIMLNKRILTVYLILKFRFRSRNSPALEIRACIVLACITTKRGTNIISRAGENARIWRYQLASPFPTFFSRPIVRARPATLVSAPQLKLKWDLFPVSMSHSRIRSYIIMWYFVAIIAL